MLLTRGAILVGNKTDLERQREVTPHVGKKLAKEVGCKFIETSSGLDHMVDELLVGVVAQVKLNPQRICRLSEKQRLILCQQNNNKLATGFDLQTGKVIRNRQGGHSTGPLNSIDLHTLKSKHGKRKSGAKSQKEAAATGGGGGTSPRANSSGQDLNEEDEDNNKSTTSSTSSSSSSINTSHSGKSSRSGGSLDREMVRFKSLVGSASCSANSTPIKRAASARQPTTPRPHHHHHHHHHSQRQRNRDIADEEVGITRDDNNDVDGDDSKLPPKPNKAATKFSNRTKMFLTSFIKFRKSLRVRRRSSSSCSDLFAI